MTTPHAILWVDHEHAQLVVFDSEAAQPHAIEIPGPSRTHLHNQRYDHGLRQGLDHIYADEFLAILRANHPAIAEKIVGVEPSDHATPGELESHAWRFFKRRPVNRTGSPG